MECDFLCVGGGLGGLAGAIAAHDAGLDVLVLEKSGLLGGVAAYSGGVVWVPDNHLQADAGYPDTLDAAAAYLDWLTPTGIDVDQPLRTAYLQQARHVFEYFTEQVGIPFEVAPRPDQYYPDAAGSLAGGRTLEVSLPGAELGSWQPLTRTSPLFKVGLTHTEVLSNGGPLVAYDKLSSLYATRLADDYRTHGPGLVAALVKAAQVDRGIRTHLTAPVVELWQEEGRVVGASAVIDGKAVQIRATRGVLIATGSYGHADYAASLEGLPDVADATPPFMTGDGLSLTDPTPAATVRAGDAIIHVGYAAPGETHSDAGAQLVRPVYRPLGCPHTIAVNRRGRRFADESFYGRFFPALRAFDPQQKEFLNYPCYLIADDRFRSRYGLPPFEPGDPWPAEMAHADTVAELAEQIGIDPQALEEEITVFNQHVEEGNDPHFGRGEIEYARLAFGDPEYPNPNLGTIEQPPFWALPLSFTGLGIYSMGLRIDPSGRALTRAGEPVPGLYATGNAVAYTELPSAYTGGFANGRNIIYAHAAARDAAQVE